MLKSVISPKGSSHFPAKSGYPGPYICPVSTNDFFSPIPFTFTEVHICLISFFPFSRQTCYSFLTAEDIRHQLGMHSTYDTAA